MKQASLILILIMSAMVCNAQQSDIDRTTVGTLDVERYMGTWFEVARYDHSFERGLEHCKAQYTLLADGRIVVENSGIDSRNGKFKLSVGKAKAGERAGQLRVSFFLFFYSEYNVMMVDENYQISLVGSKAEKYLWILSRTPVPDPVLLDMIIEEATRRGYDTSELIWVDQSRNIEALKK